MKDRVPVALLCLCALLVGGLLRPIILPAAAQSAASGSPTQAGRYSITANNYGIYFADTQTGRLWFYPNGSVVNEEGDTVKATWQEMPTPAAGLARRP